MHGYLYSAVLNFRVCEIFCFWLVVFQQLEIDYVIGETHKELLPNSSGQAAIIRIFGVTREGLLFFPSLCPCTCAILI